jgi:DNA-binding protein HU-beta
MLNCLRKFRNISVKETKNHMNKVHLIELISAGADIPNTAAKLVLESITFHIVEAVSANELVQIGGFGSFVQTHRSARMGRNPSTGLSVQIPAMKSVGFRASAAFKRQVNHS